MTRELHQVVNDADGFRSEVLHFDAIPPEQLMLVLGLACEISAMHEGFLINAERGNSRAENALVELGRLTGGIWGQHAQPVSGLSEDAAAVAVRHVLGRASVGAASALSASRARAFVRPNPPTDLEA